MARLLWMLVLCGGFAFAQEREDEGIEIDEKPSGPEAEPARTTPHPARAPGKKPATVVLKKKVYSLALPQDWVLTEFEDGNTELAWEVLLPGSTKRATLSLARADRADARSWLHYQAEWIRKEKPGQKAEVRAKPVPRLVVERSAEWNDLYFPRPVRNNVFVLQLSCAAADFAQAETDMLAAARSFAADVELHPPIPKGYETSEEGIWLIARAPNVEASLAPLVKALKEEEKRFRREHGALPRSDAPLVVLVHASKAQGAKLEPRVGEVEWNMCGDEANRRMFAVPFAKENTEQEGQLAHVAQGLLFMARYGDLRPDWIYAGERTVAQAEVYTGKPLPNLHEGFVAWASTLKLHRWDELDAVLSGDSQAWGREAFFHVAALREGKYRKQYKAFLDDYAESGDGPGAFARHLGTIDPEDLKAATNAYLSRIKPLKPK